MLRRALLRGAAAGEGGCPSVLLLTTALVLLELAEHLKTALHASLCAAFLKDGFAVPFDLLTRELEAIPVLDLSNA
jgi:hypothetical protein